MCVTLLSLQMKSFYLTGISPVSAILTGGKMNVKKKFAKQANKV